MFFKLLNDKLNTLTKQRYLQNTKQTASCIITKILKVFGLVVTARGKLPIPSRTRTIRPVAPMVLQLKLWESRSPPILKPSSSLNNVSIKKGRPIRAAFFVSGDGETCHKTVMKVLYITVEIIIRWVRKWQNQTYLKSAWLVYSSSPLCWCYLSAWKWVAAQTYW